MMSLIPGHRRGSHSLGEPGGPLRLDVAKGMDDQFGGGWRIHFSMGPELRPKRIRHLRSRSMAQCQPGRPTQTLVVLATGDCVAGVAVALGAGGYCFAGASDRYRHRLDHRPDSRAANRGGPGVLLGQWQAERLEWRGYGVEVLLLALEVDWSPSCLFEKTLCLDTLKAEQIDVTVQPSDTAEDLNRVVSACPLSTCRWRWWWVMYNWGRLS